MAWSLIFKALPSWFCICLIDLFWYTCLNFHIKDVFLHIDNHIVIQLLLLKAIITGTKYFNLCVALEFFSDFATWQFQVQLIRIQMRVPEYGWTTQKVFHFLNFFVNGGWHLSFLYF